jgi:predicted RNase H-like nuclease (RuvC/YqgF family)
MAKTFRAELDEIIREQEDEILRLSDENRHLRKASQEQRRINGELRAENSSLVQQVHALSPEY